MRSDGNEREDREAPLSTHGFEKGEELRELEEGFFSPVRFSSVHERTQEQEGDEVAGVEEGVEVHNKVRLVLETDVIMEVRGGGESLAAGFFLCVCAYYVKRRGRSRGARWWETWE